MLPRCHNIAAILDANSLSSAAGQFLLAAADTFAAILAESYLSLLALVAFFLLTLGFARSGGIGAVPGPPPLAPKMSFWDGLAVR